MLNSALDVGLNKVLGGRRMCVSNGDKGIVFDTNICVAGWTTLNTAKDLLK